MSEPLIPISRKTALTFACFFVLYEFLTYIANDMILPGMIHVVASFHAHESAVATSLTMYVLGGASLQIFLGPISDAYGRRPMMLLGAFLFFIFTLLIAFSGSMHQFLLARFFQGMGLCFIGVIGYATIQEIFAEMDAIRLIALMANVAILAPLLGPILGALIIHYYSWRWIFIMIALAALVTLWGLWRYMPESLVESNGESLVKKPFSIQTALQNYKALFTDKSFCYSAIALGLIGVPCLSWIALAPIILIKQGKLTVIQYGLWQIPIFGATILGNWTLHSLTYKYQLKTMITTGSILLTLGTVLSAMLPYLYGNQYPWLIPGILVYFFALSLTSAPLNRYCLFITQVSKGTASAVISLNIMLIGSIGIEVANYFYNHSNLNFGLFCTATIFLALLLIALTLNQSNPDKTP